MGREECSVKCAVWRKQWEVRSVKCGVWSLSLECEERSVKCEVWGLECEGSSEKWEVWSVKCGVWSLKFGVRRVQCEVWSVKTLLRLSLKKSNGCRGKDTVGTGCLWTIGHLCLGNFRRRLARVYVNELEIGPFITYRHRGDFINKWTQTFRRKVTCGLASVKKACTAEYLDGSGWVHSEKGTGFDSSKSSSIHVSTMSS